MWSDLYIALVEQGKSEILDESMWKSAYARIIDGSSLSPNPNDMTQYDVNCKISTVISVFNRQASHYTVFVVRRIRADTI